MSTFVFKQIALGGRRNFGSSPFAPPSHWNRHRQGRLLPLESQRAGREARHRGRQKYYHYARIQRWRPDHQMPGLRSLWCSLWAHSFREPLRWIRIKFNFSSIDNLVLSVIIFKQFVLPALVIVINDFSFSFFKFMKTMWKQVEGSVVNDEDIDKLCKCDGCGHSFWSNSAHLKTS